jgi:AcrR family transcriptional regulator
VTSTGTDVDPGATRRRLTKDQRRAQLLGAAEAVFAERGYGSTTFDDIAAQADVTRPLLYRHFQSVDEIYLECHRAAREEMQQRVIQATTGAGNRPRDQLQAGLTAYFHYVQERPERWDLLYGAGAAGGAIAQQTAELRFATAEQIARLFIQAAPRLANDEAVMYAHIVSGAAEQMGKWWQRNPTVRLDDVVERIMNAVWDGLNTMLKRARRQKHS